MATQFFLLITLCVVQPGKLTEQCDDYIIQTVKNNWRLIRINKICFPFVATAAKN